MLVAALAVLVVVAVPTARAATGKPWTVMVSYTTKLPFGASNAWAQFLSASVP